jgi:ABC-type transporter Mla maintaining outer membrane lipid asymmetry ATPase subunit MlaF
VSALALRYDLKRDGHAPVSVAVPGGTTQRVRLPDTEARNHLVGAVLSTRCGLDEELELFGEPVRGLKRLQRGRLHERIGVLTQAMGLISNLNAWENISLEAAYHGTQPIARIAQTAREALQSLGAEPQAFLARLPDEMDPFERKLVAFLRLLAKEPALALIDGLGEGLNREQSARAARFEAEYRARQPEGTLVFVDLAEEEVP